MAARISRIRQVIGFTTIIFQTLAFLATVESVVCDAAPNADPAHSILVGEDDSTTDAQALAGQQHAVVPAAEPHFDNDLFATVSCTTIHDAGLCPGCDNSRHGHAAGCCSHADCEAPGLFQRLADLHNKTGACWAVRSDAIILWRNAPRNRPLFDSYDPGSSTVGPTALNANMLNSDVLVAPRISLVHTDTCGDGLDITYFYAGNFYSERTLPYVRDGYVTAAPGIYGNTWGPAGTALSTANAKLLGNLQSAEINSRTAVLGGLGQFLLGIRWLQWNEQLSMTDSFSSPPPPDPITDSGTDFYSTQCFNNLFGGQLGIDATLLKICGLRIDGLVKAGAYGNWATQQSQYGYVSDGTGGPFAFTTGSRNGSPPACSFVGEVGLTAVIPLRQNLDFRCGYFGLWIEGLAQPTNQLSKQTLTQFDPPSGLLDTTGGLVLQGLSLGLEGRW